MIDSPRKLARLIWRLEEWLVTHKVYQLEATPFLQQYEAMRCILGLEDYVTQGKRRLRPTYLCYCAGCGTVYRLPVESHAFIVGSCISCGSLPDPAQCCYQLEDAASLLASLPSEVEEEFYEILASKYFAQVDN